MRRTLAYIAGDHTSPDRPTSWLVHPESPPPAWRGIPARRVAHRSLVPDKLARRALRSARRGRPSGTVSGCRTLHHVAREPREEALDVRLANQQPQRERSADGPLARPGVFDPA